MAWPTDIKFTTARLTSNRPTIRTRSLSGVETRVAIGTQRFQLEGIFNSMNSADRRKLISFLAKEDAYINAVAIPLPSPLKDNSYGYTSAIQVQTNQTAGATSVEVSGTGNADILKAGDFFTFSNHTKLYMATDDFSISSGIGTLNLFPALVSNVQATNTLTINDVEITARLANDDIVENINTNQFSQFTILFDEDI